MKKHTPRIPQTGPTLASANLPPAAPTTVAAETTTTTPLTVADDFVRIDDLGRFPDDQQRRLSADGPTYCLPLTAIKSLRKGQDHKPPLFSKADESYESDLTGRCRCLNAIGIWDGKPLQFYCLQDPTPPPTRSEMKDCGWSNQQIMTALHGISKTAEIRQRLKGYVGWLVTDRDFLAARNQLAEFWKRLPLGQRPPFPLPRALGLSKVPVGGRVADADVAQFQHDLEDLLNRWGLMSMVTWDLPEPQGPLIPAPIQPDSPAMPKHGLHIVLPIHYPVRGGDELLFEIQRQQVKLARDNGLDTSIAGLPHHQAFGQMLEVEHIERTIRSRYADRSRSPGFVSAIERAITDVLGIGFNHAKRLRKAISACKRGKRDSISWLRCRVGRVVR